MLTIAVEDAPSEVIVRTMTWQLRPGTQIQACMGKKGRPYIESRLRQLNQSAQGMKIFVLVDRDTCATCPIEWIQGILGGEKARYLEVRFAEMEVESWIMADRNAFADFFSVPVNRVPTDLNALSNPKQALVNTARRSRSSSVRDGMCPREGALTEVGPLYNPKLAEFISSQWCYDRARANSTSLSRAGTRLSQLIDR